jgi:hypothetical protein
MEIVSYMKNNNTKNTDNKNNLMTETEMEQFFLDLVLTAQYDLFAMDGIDVLF